MISSCCSYVSFVARGLFIFLVVVVVIVVGHCMRGEEEALYVCVSSHGLLSMSSLTEAWWSAFTPEWTFLASCSVFEFDHVLPGF